MTDQRISAAALAEASWLWNQVAKAVFDLDGDGFAKDWLALKWPESEASYRSRMQELYGYTRLLGNPKRIEIAQIYTELYVLDKPTAFHRYDLEEMHFRPIEHQKIRYNFERKPILSAALDQQRTFILGKPGAGKTTFLKYVTLKACAGKIPKTPIVISLKEWTDSGMQALIPFVEQQFKICKIPQVGGFIEQLFKDGTALVMFDGLDEVSAAHGQRDRVIEMLVRFAEQYDQAQILITCRTAPTDTAFTGFTVLEIADFDQTQQRIFAVKWYQGQLEKGALFLAGLEHPENKGLPVLANTPLLFALLCLVFDETLAFPPRMVDLYKESQDVLLKKWDSSHGIRRDEGYRKLSLRRKGQMLARLAAQNFEEGTYFIPEALLVSQIDQFLQTLPAVDIDEVPEGGVVLNAIQAQHGILAERAQGIYAFSHLTFQEYFSARYLVDNRRETELVDKYLTDERWRAVFLLTAGMLDEADGFFALFLAALRSWPQENPWLMALLARIKVDADRCENPHPLSVRLIGLFSIEILRGLTQAITKTSESLAHELTQVKYFTHKVIIIQELAHELVSQLALVSTLLSALATSLAPESTSIRTLAQNAALASTPVSNLPGMLASSLDDTPGGTSTISPDLVLTLQQHLFVIVDLEIHLVGYLGLALAEDGLVESLDSQKIKTVTDYIQTLQLFFDCLELAAVTERARLKDAAAGAGVS